MSYPKLTHKTEADGEVALTPAGWTQRFYKLNTGPFRFAKSTLDLSEDLFVETAQILEGTVRIDGHIAPGRLLIGIYESEEPYRLLSREQINRSMAISYDGSQWDATGAAPARGLTLHAAHPVAEQIISASHREKLARRMATPDGRQSLLLSATKEGETLAAMITRALRLASESQLTDEDPETISWWRDELIELAASIIDQVVSRDVPEEPVAGERRYRIAHEVEDILWENKIEEQSTSLEGLQQQFGCSRRTIQLAIEEQFGLTFTSLKRLIRLYRVRNALQDHGASGSITDHAVEHGFNNLGRFAKNYQQVHGILPSETVRNRRQQ